jgi:leader peptidase (prepilin peptidase)/N-methyltransferase
MHVTWTPVALIAAAVGLLLGTAVVYAAPLLVAHRIEVESRPGPSVLVPLTGGYLARWQVVRTPLWEVLCAVVLGALWLHEGGGRRALLACAYAALLLTIAYVDIDYRLVLNRLSYPGVVAALALSFFWPELGPVRALEGAALALVIFLVLQIVGRGALGAGDTKLALLIGAMRGFPAVVTAIIYGIVIGGVAAAFFLIALRRGRKTYMAYAPYLAAGAILSFFLTPP